MPGSRVLALGLAGCAATGGPVDGPPDAHCDGVDPVVVDAAVCDAAPTATAPDEGAGDDYGDTMYGSEGDDDDCKYHVSFTNTAVKAGKDVSFDVTLTTLTDGAPATGAAPRAEVFLDATHPAPNSGQSSSETADGVYDIGPVVFDESGEWTVRFHFYEACVDSETSPHGHAAFFIDVP